MGVSLTAFDEGHEEVDPEESDQNSRTSCSIVFHRVRLSRPDLQARFPRLESSGWGAGSPNRKALLRSSRWLQRWLYQRAGTRGLCIARVDVSGGASNSPRIPIAGMTRAPALPTRTRCPSPMELPPHDQAHMARQFAHLGEVLRASSLEAATGVCQKKWSSPPQIESQGDR